MMNGGRRWELVQQPQAESVSAGLRLLLADVVAPLSECLHDLGQNGSSKWDPKENQRLVYKVGQTKLCPDCLTRLAIG